MKRTPLAGRGSVGPERCDLAQEPAEVLGVADLVKLANDLAEFSAERRQDAAVG